MQRDDLRPRTAARQFSIDKERLLAFVQERLIREPLVPVVATTALFEEGWINSINILDLIGYVEHRLGRRLEDGELLMSNFRSVQSIADAFFHD